MTNDITIRIKTKATGKREVDELTKAINTGFSRGKLAVTVFNEATGNGSKIVKEMSAGIKELVGAYVGLETAKEAFKGMLDILKEAGQAQFAMATSVKAANREFQNTGTVNEWADAVKRLSAELKIYSESDIKQAVSRTVDMTKRLGLSMEQMEEVIRRAADLSAGRTDLEGGIERVTSALRGEAEASEYLGLTLNENYVKAWYKAHTAHEKAWKDLSDLEKAQVRYRVFLEQTDQFQGRAAASASTFAGALQLVKKEVSDAVANNKDLAESMSSVAAFIRDNANEIGDMASELVKLVAAIAEFAIQWKEVIAIGVSTYGVVRGVKILTTAYYGLQAAIEAVAATRLTAALLATGSAMEEATLLGVGFSQWLRFGLVLATGYAVAKLMGLIDAVKEIQEWEKTAHEAMRSRADIEAKAADKLQEISRQTGINIKSLDDFNRLVREGTLYWDEQTRSWHRATQEMIAQQAEMKLTADQMKILKEEIKGVSEGYDTLRGRLGHYFDYAARIAQRSAKTEVEAADAVLRIQRAKLDTMMKLIEKERRVKESLLSGSGAAVETISQQVTNARLAALNEWEAALESAIDRAIQREQKYAAEILRLQKKIKDARQSTADLLRDVERRGMSPKQRWMDEEVQAYETLDRAQTALAQGSVESAKEAERLFREAQRQFAGLAREVRDGDQVLVPMKKGIEAATEGIKEAGDGLEEAIRKQMAAAKKGVQDAKAAITDLETALRQARDVIDKIQSSKITPTAEIKVDSRAVDAKLAELDGKVTHSTHIIHVREVMEKRWGGLLAAGGKLPGYGGGDRIRALLEAGEYVIRKEAVNKYGIGLFDMLNNLRVDVPMALAGVLAPLENLPRRFASGGPVSSGESMTLRLQAGSVELPLTVMGRATDIREALRDFEKELSRMRLTRM